MKAMKAATKDAEDVRKALCEHGLLDNTRQIKRIAGFVFFPITDQKKARALIKGGEIVDATLAERAQRKTTLRGALGNTLSAEELAIAKRGFDVVGSIAIMEVPKELLPKRVVIARAIMTANPNVQTVLRKADIHTGEFRTQKLAYVAGKRTKETVHKENNVQIKLDVERVYFSARLATERKRVAGLVRPGETVLVMFSGCGPYSCVISKNTHAKEVYGVELNPVAHAYAVENVRLNRLGNVALSLGDARAIVPALGKKFDMILLPLPKTGEDFLSVAFSAARKKAIIHFYDFSREEEFPKASIAKIDAACKIAGLKYKVLHSVKCGAYSPRTFRVCIDFQIL